MKTEELEILKNEMKKIGLSDNVVEKYPDIMVSDLIENKSYPISEDHKIRGAAEGLEFLTEKHVLHALKDKDDIGNVLIYILFDKEEG